MVKKMLSTWAMLATAGVSMVGCLQKETTETWYLDPDAQVTWVVQETDVRSDAQAAADRWNEEASYINAVGRHDHPIARAFRELGYVDVRTRLLRATVPFTVVTDVKAGPIDGLGRRLIERLGLEGSSVIERKGDLWEWTFTIRDPRVDDSPSNETDDMTELLSSLSSLKVVLAAGRFEGGEGFTFTSDRRVAVIADLDDMSDNRPDDSPAVVLKLRWK